jgi:hypothetical protein
MAYIKCDEDPATGMMPNIESAAAYMIPADPVA